MSNSGGQTPQNTNNSPQDANSTSPSQSSGQESFTHASLDSGYVGPNPVGDSNSRGPQSSGSGSGQTGAQKRVL